MRIRALFGIARSRLGVLGLGISLCAGSALAERPDFGAPREVKRRDSVTLTSARGPHTSAMLPAGASDAIERRITSRRNGTTHLHLRQRAHGLEVIGGDFGQSQDRDGRVLSRWNHFAPQAAARVNATTPQLTAAEALAAAALALELPAPSLGVAALDSPTGAAQRQHFAGGTVSRDEVPLRLVYVPQGKDLRLAWNLVIRTPDGRHWWDAQVDAETGALLGKTDWIAREAYRVFPLPLDSPDDGPRTLESNVADATASPFGWHDTNGVAGAEFTDTSGNNVTAQEDQNGDDGTGAKPSGGAGLTFDFPIDFALVPSNYVDAATTNLFYWNNIAHDLFYQYGFDEASGNFQENNYGKGGSGSDSVNADSQDGADTNNAQFGTPPDGSNPRMEMFVFTGVGARVEVTLPVSIASLYTSGGAEFGPSPGTTGVSGSVVQALDPADLDGPSTTDGCTALTNGGAISGNIAIIDRGVCTFVIKVKNAQNAGAIAAIIVNNVSDAAILMGGTDPTITIPSLFIGQSDGDIIKAELGAGVEATLRTLVDRDSSLDAGIILHEYGHGVSNRLTGGAGNANCLDVGQSVSMGEGWSDFFALSFTATQSDLPTDEREMGTYVLGKPNGPGIRTHPYTTDLVANPLTLIDVETRSVPHAVGTVWAEMIWEVYWELVNAYGFDADFYAGSGGNNLAIQLVMDGLKLQACDPTFIQARDAIIAADVNETGGANECFLWRAFAKRGIGDSATIASNPIVVSGVVEDFSVPSQCNDFCGDGTLDVGEECDDSNRINGDGCTASCDTESTVVFSGTATGGIISLVIDGVMLAVVTSPGESAAQVAANVAAAIGGDPTLVGLGVTATGVGDTLYTNGDITVLTIKDNGLAPNSVPFGPVIAPLLGLALLGAGLRRLRARSAPGAGGRRR